MCSDALEFDNFLRPSESNREIAERDAHRVLEAYGRALSKIHFDLKIEVDIILIGYNRVSSKGFGFREYRFAVFEKGTDKFIDNYLLHL